MTTERITQNVDISITPAKQGSLLRNTLGRVYLRDGEDFEVIVKTTTDSTVVAKGKAKAAAGKLCSIYTKVRAEADVNEPKPPTKELV